MIKRVTLSDVCIGVKLRMKKPRCLFFTQFKLRTNYPSIYLSIEVMENKEIKNGISNFFLGNYRYLIYLSYTRERERERKRERER